MPKKSPSSDHAKISAAALRLAAEKGWERVTPDAVIKAAKIKGARSGNQFTSKHQIAALIVDQLSREALAHAGQTQGSPHDVLFDLLMARFDVLQKNRSGVLAIAHAARRDRGLASTLARAVMQSMHEVGNAAALPTLPPSLAANGLSVLYAYVFLMWRRDETRDMAKTMAALDRALRLSDRAVGLFRHVSRR